MATAQGRLWIVSELYYPEQTSTGYFLTRIAEGLAADFDVHVICGRPSYSERGTRAARFEVRRGTKIHRLPATHFNKDNLILRMINLATLTFAIVWFSLWRFQQGDRVLVVTNPPTVPIVIGLIAGFRRCWSVLLVHDVYPEVLAATSILAPTSRSYGLLTRLFKSTYSLFDRIVVLGRDMADVVAAKITNEPEKVVIIPNWGDVDEIAPIDRCHNPFRQEHGLDGKFIVQFSGNIGRTHDVELVLEAARLLRAEDHIHFLFVGYGGKSRLVENVAHAGLDNVQFLPRQPRDRLCEMLAASDTTIVSLIDGMFGLSVPSRMYNIMAAGVPILAIAHSRSELSLSVVEQKAGWVLDDRRPSALASLIRSLATVSGREEAARRGAAGRKAVETHYRLDSILEKYRALLKK